MQETLLSTYVRWPFHTVWLVPLSSQGLPDAVFCEIFPKYAGHYISIFVIRPIFLFVFSWFHFNKFILTIKFLNNILNTIIWKMNMVGFFWKSFSLLTWYREISPSRGTECFTEEILLLEIKPLFFKCVLRESYVKILIAI